MDTIQQQIKKLEELEAIGLLLQDKNNAFLNDCRKARRKLEGVSTSRRQEQTNHES